MHTIFLDFEMNAVAKEHMYNCGCADEIIEIGAVRVNKDHEITSTFKSYVRPVLNNTIMRKVQKLTHISMDMVKDKPLLPQAMEDFLNWCGDDCVIYSWSATDLLQIKAEYSAKKMAVPERLQHLMDHWGDYQREFATAYHAGQIMSLEKAVNDVGLNFTGRAHDALNDAINTAHIYICCHSTDFEDYQRARKEAYSNHVFSMMDMCDFSKLQLAV